MLEDNTAPLDSHIQETTIELYLQQDDEIENYPESIEKPSLGDLYLLGKLWIDILQTGLLGTKWKLPPLLPVVEAAPPPPPPQKPAKMKYRDLPLYTSPHYEYKDYVEDKPKCPDLKRKLIHERLLPHVKSIRKDLLQNYTDFVTEFASMKKQAVASITCKKNEFLCYMRCGKNLQMRQGVLVLGGVAGFLLSRKYRGRTSPRIAYTTIGLLAAGALCFPKETDETFRILSLATGKLLITLYNKYCGKEFGLRDRLPCQADLPGPLAQRTANKCPVKK